MEKKEKSAKKKNFLSSLKKKFILAFFFIFFSSFFYFFSFSLKTREKEKTSLLNDLNENEKLILQIFSAFSISEEFSINSIKDGNKKIFQISFLHSDEKVLKYFCLISKYLSFFIKSSRVDREKNKFRIIFLIDENYSDNYIFSNFFDNFYLFPFFNQNTKRNKGKFEEKNNIWCFFLLLIVLNDEEFFFYKENRYEGFYCLKRFKDKNKSLLIDNLANILKEEFKKEAKEAMEFIYTYNEDFYRINVNQWDNFSIMDKLNNFLWKISRFLLPYLREEKIFLEEKLIDNYPLNFLVKCY